MAKKVKIGFIGSGFMGQRAHLINYLGLPDCELAALAEPREKMAGEVAKRYGIKEIYKDHVDLLNNADVDAVIACQPFENHINIVPDILKAKKALLTEKPISVSWESGEYLAKLAEENNVPYMIGYHKRSDPAIEYAKAIVEEWKNSGEYGRMRLIRITMPPGEWTDGVGIADMIYSEEPYPDIIREGAPEYFSKEMGHEYIAFVNYYIHQVNAMRFLLGEPYKVTYAEKTGVLMVGQSSSGVCTTLEMAPYSRSMDWKETLFVAFEKGYVKVQLPAPLACQQPGVVTVYGDRDKGKPILTQPILPRVSAMKNQAMNFLSVVRGEKQAPCGPKEAAEDLKIARDYIKMKCH